MFLKAFVFPEEEQIADVLSLIEADIDNKKFNPLLVYSDQSYLIVPVKNLFSSSRSEI